MVAVKLAQDAVAGCGDPQVVEIVVFADAVVECDSCQRTMTEDIFYQ